MSSPTPVRDGFRSIWRQPSIFFAELAWRWSWGGAAIILIGLALFEYLQTLFVTPTDLMLLRLRHPLAVSRALADIFHGSGPRVLLTTLVLIPSVTLLWAALGSLGRWTTLRALVVQRIPDWEGKPGSIRTLFGLHVLRIALGLAGLLSYLGAAVVGSFVSSTKAPHAGLALLLFSPMAVVVSMVWSYINWFLSLAPIFVVRDGEDTFGSIAATGNFFGRCRAKISGVGFWFGAMHLVAFVIGTTVVMYPLLVAALVPPGVTLLLMGLIALAYFAVADYLYVARLAGYLAVAEWDRLPQLEPEAVSGGENRPSTVGFGPMAVPALRFGGHSLLGLSLIEEISVDETLADEPLFLLRPLADEDCDEPIMPGFSPGEPLAGR